MIDDCIQSNPLNWGPMYVNYEVRTGLNSDLPQYESGATIEDGWRPLEPSESIYHQKGDGNEKNIKYINIDGREAIYDKNGNLLIDDHLNGGTYNWGVLNDNNVYTYVTSRGWHFITDMMPYYLYGDGPDDPTNIFERIFGYYRSGEGVCPNE